MIRLLNQIKNPFCRTQLENLLFVLKCNNIPFPEVEETDDQELVVTWQKMQPMEVLNVFFNNDGVTTTHWCRTIGTNQDTESKEFVDDKAFFLYLRLKITEMRLDI